MLDILNEVWAYALTQDWGVYLTTLATMCYLLTLIVPLLPVAWTEKIPNIVMRLLNFLAAKSIHAKLQSKAALTDHNGNVK